MTRRPHRIAVIGCGAVTELFHLPALARSRLTPTLLIDKNLQRAHRLAGKFGVPRAAQDYRSERGAFDAAILALPHHLHAPVAQELLGWGIHVLVEKPMAMNVAECRAMIAAAKESRAVLAVGLVRRFFPALKWVKHALEQRLLGDLHLVDIREGGVYNWPAASDYIVRGDAGGGVLLDTGAHTLDLLVWWMGAVEHFVYHDDNRGGVEAECEVELTLAGGVKGHLILSRLRNLRNTALFRGEAGAIEVDLLGRSLRAEPAGLLSHSFDHLQGDRLGRASLERSFQQQIQDWLGAIEERRQPYVSGEEAMASIELMDAFKAHRRPLVYPWQNP